MKKILLSFFVIISFGTYVFFLRMNDIAKYFSVSNPAITDLINTKLNDASSEKVVRATDCVYISSDEDEVEDDEEGETTKSGHYKCTTTIVTPPTKTPDTKPTTTPPPSTNPPTNTPPVVVTPPPITKPKNTGLYKDGTYIGDTVDAFYGNVQVSISVSGGRLSSISFLDYPQDRSTSLQKSNFAMPILKSEAIKSQNANVNTVSGVTYTSEAFIESLSSALKQAKNI